MADAVSICNDALGYLGSKFITALDDGTPNARACNQFYATTRDELLQTGSWWWAIRRVELAASVTAPVFTRANAFPLPADFVKRLPLDPEDQDPCSDQGLEIVDVDDGSGNAVPTRCVVTSDAAPLAFRYVYKVENVGLMSPAFCGALAAELAVRLVEVIRPSNVKMQTLQERAAFLLARAKYLDGKELPAVPEPEGDWVAVRGGVYRDPRYRGDPP